MILHLKKINFRNKIIENYHIVGINEDINSNIDHSIIISYEDIDNSNSVNICIKKFLQAIVNLEINLSSIRLTLNKINNKFKLILVLDSFKNFYIKLLELHNMKEIEITNNDLLFIPDYSLSSNNLITKEELLKRNKFITERRILRFRLNELLRDIINKQNLIKECENFNQLINIIKEMKREKSNNNYYEEIWDTPIL